MSRISAIIPAFNEALRIGDVLRVVTSHPDIFETIVVDDGSLDTTSDVVRQDFPSVILLRNEINCGKGASMNRGASVAHGDIFFFSDADIRELTHEHISSIVQPVATGAYDMYIGIIERYVHWIPGILHFLPTIGGERAVTRKLWEEVPPFYKEHFRVETGLNFYAQHFGKGYGFTVLRGLDHATKEVKYGLLEGFVRRAKMIFDVCVTYISLVARLVYLKQ